MNKLKQKINKMNNNERRVFYASSVVLFLLVLLNIFGLSFAWFSALVIGNDTAKSAVVETGSLSIVYTNSNELRGTNVMPGWSETKTFTVENTGTVKATYNINWNNLLNEFTNKEDLVYTLTSDNNGGTLTETILPDNGEHLRIISDIDIEPGVIQTYTLTVTYKNREKDQNIDKGKKLIGKIEVLDSNEDINSSSKDAGAYALIDKCTDDNTEGLIKIDQPATIQTKETTEYRYSGRTPKNYVNFNDESWRIIGIFDTDDGTGKIEKRMKIIRTSPVGGYVWDSSASSINSGYGSNQWGPTGSYPGADLMRVLNPGYDGISGSLYWNREKGSCYGNGSNGITTCDFTSTGLKENAKNMISDIKWYTGASINRDTTSNQFYINERSNKVGQKDNGQTIIKTSNWTGKVALISASDYGYASSECYNNTPLYSTNSIDYSQNKCKNSNWLYNGYFMWLITPCEETNSRPFDINTGGMVYTSGYAYSASKVNPSIYLKSSVKITSGTGSSIDPYQLSL